MLKNKETVDVIRGKVVKAEETAKEQAPAAEEKPAAEEAAN